MAVVCLEELQQRLHGYCNWASLPQDLLLKVSTSTPAAARTGDNDQLQHFLRHMVSFVPSEWSVTQHSVFDHSGSSNQKRLHAMMHASAVGTEDGLMCFGGVQMGVLQEVKVDNEVSWIKNSEPGGLAPDVSRVYQVCTRL